MQIMCRWSEEGNTECLGIFDSKVKKFIPDEGLKVPHMGWNKISNLESKLFKDLAGGSYVYYVHSYYPELCPDTIATTVHGKMFSGALKYENFYGTQFHPEKSGDIGEQIIKNFLAL
jgi:glutamine amidotransferase